MNLIGKVFGRWKVIEKDSTTNKYRWICICSCKKIKSVLQGSLIEGSSKSCGCLLSEITIQRCTKHNLSKTVEYHAWQSMRDRCNNKNNKSYKNYGGRGIKVCKRWQGNKGFQNFYADMGKRPSLKHSIDRKNNDGNYTPSNCRWATGKEQAQNTSQTKFFEYNNKKLCMVGWAKEIGINRCTLRKWLQRNKSLEWICKNFGYNV